MARSDYYIRKKTNVSTINYYKYKLIGLYPIDKIPEFKNPIYKRYTEKGVVVYEEVERWSVPTGRSARRGRPCKNAKV